jgi:membrane glycosyltransferase
MLAFGMATGFVSLWLLPIMASLVAAAPLSRLSAVPLPGLLATPQEVRAPLVAARARHWRAVFRAQLTGAVPAE